jgi:hypothetical protein
MHRGSKAPGKPSVNALGERGGLEIEQSGRDHVAAPAARRL